VNRGIGQCLYPKTAAYSCQNVYQALDSLTPVTSFDNHYSSYSKGTIKKQMNERKEEKT